MGKILEINEIADKHAGEITYKVQKKRELNQDSRAFGEVIQEEIDKLNKKEAIKNTGK